VNDCVYICRHYYITDYTIECKYEANYLYWLALDLDVFTFYLYLYEVNLVDTTITANESFSLVMKIWIKRNLNDEITL